MTSMARIFYKIILYTVSVSGRESFIKINVLNVSKYPLNAILRSANINAQRANVTGSIHNRGRLCRTRLRSPDACILLVIIASEASFLVSSMARIFYKYIYINIYIYICDRI